MEEREKIRGNRSQKGKVKRYQRDKNKGKKGV
jgi:hypothetical protein